MTELLTVADVARITGLSEYTVREAIRDGDLKASKLRNRLRVRNEDLVAWVDDSQVQPVMGTLLPGPLPTVRVGKPVPAGGYRALIRKKAA